MADEQIPAPAQQQQRDQEQQQQQQYQQQPLRSIVSRQHSYVRFVNRTQRSVQVLWVSYQSEHRLYKTLPPGGEYNVNTYVTHPWVFRDAETGATLLVNSEEVFFPKPIFPEGHARHGPVSPYRVPVYISIPLYTLKDRAAQVVGSCLQNAELVYSLDIPRNLMSNIAKWVV